jgi:hypothetical protein
MNNYDAYQDMVHTTSIKITNTSKYRENSTFPNSIEIVIPRDSSLDEWEDVFKTILIHQGFGAKLIEEFFAKE